MTFDCSIHYIGKGQAWSLHYEMYGKVQSLAISRFDARRFYYLSHGVPKLRNQITTTFGKYLMDSILNNEYVTLTV